MEAALYGEGGFFAAGHGAGRRAATSSRAPRSVRSSARASPARSTGCGARSTSPIRSSWSKRAPGNGRLAREVLRAAPACLPRAAVRARRAFGGAARRAARAPRARTGRRGARPVRAARRRRPGRARARGAGPVFTALEELPALGSTGGRARQRAARQPAVRDRAVRTASAGSRCGSAGATGRVRRGARPGRRRRSTLDAVADGRRRAGHAAADPAWHRRVVRGRARACCATASCSSSTTRRRVAELGERGRGCARTGRTRRGPIRSTRPASRTSPPTSCSSSSTPAAPFGLASCRSTARPTGSRRSVSTSSSPRAGGSGRRAPPSAISRRSPAAAASTEAAALTDPAGLGAHHVVLFGVGGRPVRRSLRSSRDAGRRSRRD